MFWYLFKALPCIKTLPDTCISQDWFKRSTTGTRIDYTALNIGLKCSVVGTGMCGVKCQISFDQELQRMHTMQSCRCGVSNRLNDANCTSTRLIAWEDFVFVYFYHGILILYIKNGISETQAFICGMYKSSF